MKLIRFGNVGDECPGVIDDDGDRRDASGVIDDWNGEALERRLWEKLAVSELPLAPKNARWASPIARVGKLVGIGLNYKAHAAESGMSPPEDPIIFLKATSAICGAFDNIILPRGSVCADWEVELAVVMGKSGSYIKKEEALSYVCGYCILNDLSEREYQLKRGTQWTKGKSADTFAPMGPWLTTADEIDNPQNLELSLSLNGERMQTGCVKDMIFSVAELISRVSEYMSWQAGDVMTTGTPPGVGMGQKPPRYLRDGDLLTLNINGLGEQRTTVVDFK